MPDETQPLPPTPPQQPPTAAQQQPTPQQQPPTPAQQQPTPPQQHAAWPPPAGAAPTGSPDPYAGVGPQPAMPPRRPNLWHQAVSTTGGKVATGLALGLTALLLLGVLGIGLVALVHDRGRTDRAGVGTGQGDGGRREPGDMMRGAPGNGQRRDAPTPGTPGDRTPGQGGGLGGLGSLGGLGAVQHGEFTATGSDGKPVVMTVQRGSVSSSSSTSLAVKSDDGFTATYGVNSSTRQGAAGTPATGDQVTVVARKADKVAVLVRTMRRG